jgi:hypothetical protein
MLTSQKVCENGSDDGILKHIEDGYIKRYFRVKEDGK